MRSESSSHQGRIRSSWGCCLDLVTSFFFVCDFLSLHVKRIPALAHTSWTCCVLSNFEFISSGFSVYSDRLLTFLIKEDVVI